MGQHAMNGFIKMWLRMLNHGGCCSLNNKNAAAPIVVVIFLLNSLLQKTKAIYYPRACDFSHFTKPRGALLFRAYPKNKRIRNGAAARTKEKQNQKRSRRQNQFPWACSLRDLFRAYISSSAKRRPGWSSALIVH